MFRAATGVLKLNIRNLGSKILILRVYLICVHPIRFLIKNQRFYNKTEFSGLETHILNSYTNAVVQVMHYLRPIRQLAKAHITVNCPHEHCLLCELGFISRMLEDAQGTNCQASNFCKTVGVLAHGWFHLPF
jgi:hypothetical protein